MTRGYVKVNTMSELLALEMEPGAQILCGGTDLVVKMRAGVIDPRTLIDISETEGLRGIERRSDCVEIGSATTIDEIAASSMIRRTLPLLAMVLDKLGSPQIRSRATLGGNLVNASPAADSAIPLLLYDAQLLLVRSSGERSVAVEDFFVSPGKTALAHGEYVRAISIPTASGDLSPFFHKIGRRKALIIAIASLGSLFKVRGDVIDEIRLAAGSVAPRPLRLRELEELLTGKRIDEQLIEQAKSAAMQAVSPIDDIRASADYRREVIGELVARMLRAASQ